MSTATITFYKSTKIQSTRNMKIDDLEAYLSTKTSLVKEKVQYQKTCNLEFNIKLNLSQTWIDFLPAYDYDYCKILNTGSTKALYYFITKRSWKSENTIEFHVVLDTINSFSIGKSGDTADYLISQRTNVLREHKNRWTASPSQSDIDVLMDNPDYQMFVGGIFTAWFYQDKSEEPYEVTPNMDLSSGNIVVNNVYDDSDNEWDPIPSNWEFTFGFVDADGNPVESGYGWLVVSIQHISTIQKLRGTASIDATITIRNKRYRIIDLQNEGIQPVLYKKNTLPLLENIDTSWNLIYKTSHKLSTEENNPVDCFLIPSEINFKVVREDGEHTEEMDLTELATADNNSYWFSFAPRYIEGRFAATGKIVTFRITYTEGGETKYYQCSTSFYENSRGGISQQILVLQRYTDNGVDKTRGWFVRAQFPVNLRPYYQYIKAIDNISSVKVADEDLSIACYHWTSGSHLNNPAEDVYYAPNENISIDNGTEEFAIGTLGDIDRTESTLIKIISIPYCPSAFAVELDETTKEYSLLLNDKWSIASMGGVSVFQLDDLSTKFNRYVVTTIDNPIYEIASKEFSTDKVLRNDEYESKLFHSDFYQLKFVYDSFSYVFQLEKFNFEYSNIPVLFGFTFIMTTTINSRFLFMFSDYVLENTNEDYDNICAVARNNEETIYNSTYLTYLRNGYNYDVKARDRSITANTIGLGASVLATGVGIAVGIATQNPAVLVSTIVGGTASIITSSVNTANAINNTEQALEQKQAQLRSQAVSVAGSDDIDLLTAYSGNRAMLVEYRVSDRMKKALADLFYYTGYVCNERKVPSYNTRRYFNFVQMEIDIIETNALSEEVINDLAMRWKNGVTIFHKYNNEYDIDQIYENWEVNLNG